MRDLAIYVHIPFCVRKCRYCDFLSAPGNAKERTAYLQALMREMRYRSAELQKYRVKTIFWGGGTPSLLEAPAFEEAAAALRACTGEWAPDVEWTVEANPGTLCEDKVESWRRMGVNRVSLGVQATQEHLLRRIGRIHTWEQAVESVKTLREAGFSNINLDLMMGLPGQSLDDWTETLERGILLGPEHLSCYSLILEEGTPLYEDVRQGRESLPEEEAERAMYNLTLKRLQAAGYMQYEISNFAKPGYHCRHNLVYWELGDYQGLGLGAASYIEGVRRKNTEDLCEYVQAENPVVCERIEEENSLKNQMEEWMFLGLRKTAGVDLREFQDRFGHSAESVYGETMRDLQEEGLILRKGDQIMLSRRGLDLANQVFVAFLL